MRQECCWYLLNNMLMGSAIPAVYSGILFNWKVLYKLPTPTKHQTGALSLLPTKYTRNRMILTLSF